MVGRALGLTDSDFSVNLVFNEGKRSVYGRFEVAHFFFTPRLVFRSCVLYTYLYHVSVL